MKPQTITQSEKPRLDVAKSAIVKSSVVLALCRSVGCGTTSGLKGSQTGTKVGLLDYNRVVVEDLVDDASAKELPDQREQKRRQMARACGDFADWLAKEIEQRHVAESVTRAGAETADESTLVIRGHISRFEEGSATARLWVGMGAGSS